MPIELIIGSLIGMAAAIGMAGILPAIIGAVGAIAGGALAAGKKTDYGKPTVVDPAKLQQTWLNSQQGMLPQTYEYLNASQALSDEEQRRRIMQAAPWAAEMEPKVTGNYASYLSGGLTPEEEQLIRQNVAGRAAVLGVPGGEMQNRWALGSLLPVVSGRQQQATYAYPSFLSSMAAPYLGPSASIWSLMPTYGQYGNIATGNAAAQNEFAIRQAEANAQPNPMLANIGTTMSGLGGMLTRYGLQNQGGANPYAFSMTAPGTAGYMADQNAIWNQEYGSQYGYTG